MKKIDQWLAESASEIERRLQKELASYIAEFERNLNVRAVREYWDYQFKVFLDDEFVWMTRSMDCSSRNPVDHLDIDSLVEELVLGLSIIWRT